MKAIWNGKTIAQSDDTVVVEGNHYFSENTINREFIEKNDKKTSCPWKGVASYYNIVVDGERNTGAAWYYPEPKDAAKEILNRVAFSPSGKAWK